MLHRSSIPTLISGLVLAAILFFSPSFQEFLSKDGEGDEQQFSASLSVEKTFPSPPARLPLSEDIFARARSNPDFVPIRDWSIPHFEIKARAGIAFDVKRDKILFKKNIHQKLSIASLTKLMTALIVLENKDLEEIVKVSKNAVMTEGEAGGLVVDEEISVRNLLYAMLIESSNDAAVALAEGAYPPKFSEKTGEGKEGEKDFVGLMNEKAQEIGLQDTHFSNPAGLDAPDNFSTAYDLVKLTEYALNYPLIWRIFRTPLINVYSKDGWISHYLVNTNKLLDKIPNTLGGKTGYTEEAGECMILVTESPYGKGSIIYVVLGAEDRFGEMERLVSWVGEAYRW